eukprot:g28981.t1
MRKVKLGLASAGALSASFLKVFGGGNSQDCNQCNTQHTAPPPLESGSGSPSNAHPFQSSTSFSRVQLGRKSAVDVRSGCYHFFFLCSSVGHTIPQLLLAGNRVAKGKGG